MAWSWNPAEWGWTNAASRAGYRVLGGAADKLGYDDTAEFLRTAGNPEYIAAPYRDANPVAIGDATPEQIERTQKARDLAAAEASRYTHNVVTNLGPKWETSAATGAQVGTGTIGALITPGHPVAGFVAGQQIGENLIDMSLPEGEAPVRSLRRVYSPVGEKTDLGPLGNAAAEWLEVRQDAHYANSGTENTHPNRISYQQQRDAEARRLAQQNAPGMLDQFKEIAASFGLGKGTLIGLIIGGIVLAATYATAPVIGIAALAAGTIGGQWVMDKINQPQSPAAQTHVAAASAAAQPAPEATAPAIEPKVQNDLPKQPPAAQKTTATTVVRN